MIKFLIKGIIRDKNRSLLPIMVVTIGVFLTVLMSGWMKGIFSDMIDLNANFTTGHVKVMTKVYAENESQYPNDLALMGVNELISNLSRSYPDMKWVPRIQFGCLLDVPDSLGETRAQGPGIGKAVDLFSKDSGEVERMNLKKSLVSGELPKEPGEALISNDFAEQFGLKLKDKITIFGSTMEGSMMFKTFIVSGTIKFGVSALDRGAIIIDISDAQLALDMEDASSEVLGYFNTGIYDHELALNVKNSFNEKYIKSKDEFAPVMKELKDESGLGQYIDLADNISSIMVIMFVIAMSIVLWNAGLLGGLRRYYEFGIRLALGENKNAIFKSLIYEAIIVGFIGSVIGTALGLGAVYYLQEVGFDVSGFVKDVTMMIPTVYRAKVTPDLFYIGFIPGLLAMVLGNALAGFSIYKRNTAKLFKELEV